MKVIPRLTAPRLRRSLLAIALLTLLPAPGFAATDSFGQLVNTPDYRNRYQNRIEQELQRWQGSKPDPQLYDDVRMLFNLSPRHRSLRPAFSKMVAANAPAGIQDQELNYYRLLNLEPRNEAYRRKLSELSLRKHGGYSAAEVSTAYRFLNDAFNAWDEQNYDQALRLFKQAHLPKSPELTALYASHLRDRGQDEAARKLLAGFTGERGYLGWIDGLSLQLRAAESVLASALPESDRITAWLTMGKLSLADEAIERLPEGPTRHWHRAKWLEKQGRYHEASAEYHAYAKGLWAGDQAHYKGFVPVVYKAQLEDVNSLDLIALKFRTTPELIRRANQNWQHDWVETYRMLVIPVASHELRWPTTGYVSSHFGYRLHPIRGTWRLHEGIDIETRPGVQANAAATGTVVQAYFDKECGNVIRMQHAEPGLRTVFCHGQKLLVANGARVEVGKPVMVTGNTGTSSASNHLHFGVQLNGVFVDPMDWL